MSSTFCSDFFANFLADLLVAVAIGAPIAYFIGKKLDELARGEQLTEARKHGLRRGIRYLEPLKSEIKTQLKFLPGMIEAFEATGYGTLIRMGTPFWDALQPSGELPKLIDTNLMESIAEFYGHLTYASRQQDFITRAWLAPHNRSVPGLDKKIKAGVKTSARALRTALKDGTTLPKTIDEEITRLQRELDAL